MPIRSSSPRKNWRPNRERHRVRSSASPSFGSLSDSHRVLVCFVRAPRVRDRHRVPQTPVGHFFDDHRARSGGSRGGPLPRGRHHRQLEPSDLDPRLSSRPGRARGKKSGVTTKCRSGPREHETPAFSVINQAAQKRPKREISAHRLPSPVITHRSRHCELRRVGSIDRWFCDFRDTVDTTGAPDGTGWSVGQTRRVETRVVGKPIVGERTCNVCVSLVTS